MSTAREHIEMAAHDARPDHALGTALSRAEIFEAIKTLGDGEKTSLAKIARLYATKTPYDGADLLQEAICRVLSGERTWPKGVPTVLLLGGVIRSIAWQWRQKEAWSGSATDIASVGPPQEWVVFLDEFVGSLADDPCAQAVLVAAMAGSKGQELLAVIEPILNAKSDPSTRASASELERELERVLKKIRRRVEKHRREGGSL